MGVRPQLGRLVAAPLLTIGVLAAILEWEIEHVGSIGLALVIFGGLVFVAVFVARRVRRRIESLADHYETLLTLSEEQSQRLEAANRSKDEFLATLSHELRTPLNLVLGWSRLLSTGRLSDTESHRAIDAIERAGRTQSRLVEDLLDLSHAASGRLHLSPRPTEVEPIVEAVVESLHAAADAKEISVNVGLDPAADAIAVDPDRFHQMIWNLLSNAIKFTPPRGHVWIGSRREPAGLVLSVKDDGIGFPPETAAHLFERFRQGDASTTRQHGGLGLGLAIVRHLAELHGGSVSARSEGKQRGSAFELRLPLRPVGERPPGIAPQPIREELLSGISVLVVDDDAQALEMTRASLEQFGARVACAGSGREARARFERQPPDVLVSDLKMKEQDGFELIRELRAFETPLGRHVPAIALSGLARADDKTRAIDAGFQRFFRKPLDPQELATAVERLAHPTSQANRRAYG